MRILFDDGTRRSYDVDLDFGARRVLPDADEVPDDEVLGFSEEQLPACELQELQSEMLSKGDDREGEEEYDAEPGIFYPAHRNGVKKSAIAGNGHTRACVFLEQYGEPCFGGAPLSRTTLRGRGATKLLRSLNPLIES